MLREEIIEALEHSKIGKDRGPSEVYAEIILAIGDNEIRVLMESCQKILDEKGMLAD